MPILYNCFEGYMIQTLKNTVFGDRAFFHFKIILLRWEFGNLKTTHEQSSLLCVSRKNKWLLKKQNTHKNSQALQVYKFLMNINNKYATLRVSSSYAPEILLQLSVME